MTDQTELETSDQDTRAKEIIRKHMMYSMAGGAIPIPIVDLAAVTAVQLDMLKQLAATYDVRLDAKSTRAFVTSLTSTLAGATLARVGASLMKIVPGVGTLAGGATQVVVTGASTYAVGNLFKRLFKENRSIDDLDVQSVKDEFLSYFEAGKERALSLKDKVADKVRRN